MNQKAWALQAFFLYVCLMSCVTTQGRYEAAQKTLTSHSYTSQNIRTSVFTLFSAAPPAQINPSETLRIVIEGDGFAWANRYTPSDNPTPRNAVGLDIALLSHSIYLARPCQYVWDDKLCKTRYWTEDRFAAPVLQAYMEALDQLKSRYQAKTIEITGYSGGAYIAMALAAQRQDIVTVLTVSGLIDPADWTRFHQISDLNVPYSKNELLKRSKSTKFIHLCSTDDDVIPCALNELFISYAENNGFRNHQLKRVADLDHEDGSKLIQAYLH